ncbi:hypothetical protein CEXT_569751 [Caerostris extrusa]|uniref:Uncharacterized protein n=1 Tax=Caerostris extrusa TaxID=172846 RepID=A0AAV4XCS8_CAEEX|nr:hypothetical protein CEXT_569751 [Caerostris extrusa]
MSNGGWEVGERNRRPRPEFSIIYPVLITNVGAVRRMKQMSLSNIPCCQRWTAPLQQSSRGEKRGDSTSFCQSGGILIVLRQLYMLIPTSYPEGRTLNPDARAFH